jgi:hypothetical protein
MLGPGLVALEVAGVQLERSLGIVTHRQRTLSNAASAMQEQLLAAADQT